MRFDFIDSLIDAGGECYLYGGAIRDEFLKIEPLDFDFIIKNMDIDKIQSICSEFGEARLHKYMPGSLRLNSNEFGIIDICLPKKLENKTFNVSKNYTISDHLKSLDFTMNCIAKNIKTDEIYDEYDGIRDIENKKIVLNPFHESIELLSPVIIIRAARFMSEFDFNIDDRTMSIFIKESNLVFNTQPELKLQFEMYKLFKSKNFVKGLQFLKELNILNGLLDIYNKEWKKFDTE